MGGRIVLYDTTRPGLVLSYVSKANRQWVAEGGAWFEPVYDSDQPLTWEHKSWGRTSRSPADDFVCTYLGVIHDPHIGSVRISLSENRRVDATIFTLGEHRLWFVLLAPGEVPKITGLSSAGEILFEIVPE